MVEIPFCEVNQIHYVLKCWRPLCSEEDMESNVKVFSVAKDGFMHIISSFKIFAVSLKHAIVKGLFGQELECDVFFRNCSSLDRHYPAELIIKDAIIIKIS